jgi:hypothetical protein
LLKRGLAGIAFAVVSIPSAVFRSVVMIVLFIIPGIVTKLVWCLAVIILAEASRLHGEFRKLVSREFQLKAQQIEKCP